MASKNTVNRGWFRRGADPRRHALTREERSRGGREAWRRYGFWVIYAGPFKK